MDGQGKLGGYYVGASVWCGALHIALGWTGAIS